MPLTNEQKLAEAEELIRTAPDADNVRNDSDDFLEWCARCQVLAAEIDLNAKAEMNIHIGRVINRFALDASRSLPRVLIALRQIRHSLRLELGGPVNLAIGAGARFDYFEALRNIIAEARDDLLFVDPYIDADFVARYLAPLEHRPTVRLLTSQRLRSLVPAAELLVAQSGIAIHVRSDEGLHDRYVIIDRASCFQSGASFKDGAKNSPTTLTQVTDLFPQLLDTYERAWDAATVHLPRAR